MNKKGKNRVSIEFVTHKSANGFLKNSILVKENLKAYIPASLASCKGARGIDTNLSMEELMCYAESPQPIFKARRMKKRIVEGNESKLVDPEDVLITFRRTRLPISIRTYNVESKIDLYIPAPMQCYNCLRCGHLANQCREKMRCAKCTEEHKTEECSQNPLCVFCEKNHAATDRRCEEYLRQKEIKITMVLENISYFEARKKHPKNASNKDDGNSNMNNRNLFSKYNHPQEFPRFKTYVSETVDISQRS